MGQVFSRGEGKQKRYFIRVDVPPGPDGKRRRIVRRVYGTLKDANTELDRVEREIHSGGVVTPAKLTVGEILNRWLASVERSIQPATYGSYSRQVSKLAEALGAIRLQHLNALHIEEWLAGAASARKRGQGPLSNRSVELQWRVLSMALDQARKWRMISFNPCEAVSSHPSAGQPKPRFLDADRAASLLEAIRHEWLYLPSLLALAGGLRAGEVCALRWSDVDFDGGTILVAHSMDSSVPGKLILKSTKSGAIARVLLPREAMDEIKIARALSSSPYVVCEPDGRPTDPERLSKRFSQRARSLGFDITFHGLRHTHGALLVDADVHPRVAMEQMRHSTPEMWKHYAHVKSTLQAQAAEHIGRAIFKNRPGGPAGK